MDLSLVIPAFEEAHRIGRTLAAIEEFLQAQEFSCEVIVIIDGGGDDTMTIVEEFIESGPHSAAYRALELPKNMGKGVAVQEGVAIAGGKLIGFTDADLPFGMEAVERARSILERNADVDMVIGNRNARTSSPASAPPLLRRIAGRVYSWLVQGIVRTGISDTQCGLKMFRAHVAKALFARTTIAGFGFDVELIHIARVNGLRIERIPVDLYQHEGSRVNLLADSAKMLLDLFRIRVQGMRRLYQFEKPTDPKSP